VSVAGRESEVGRLNEPTGGGGTMRRREFCQGVVSVAALGEAAVAAAAPMAGERPAGAGRPVRVTSLSFHNRSLAEVAALVDAEGARGADLIALPEMWAGSTEKPESLEGAATRTLCELARKHRAYIVSPIHREAERRRLNTAVLIDRAGKIAGVYDKVYPYWGEFQGITPPTEPGESVPVFQTDFGKIGLAICFDVNFPEVWQRLADRGAEVVVWPSAYSAGSSLQAHALNHHFYIVTSTWLADCSVFDITGKEVHYQKSERLNVSRVTLDLDRGIYHENFNVEKRDRLLKEHHDAIGQEVFLQREQWFVLQAKRPGASARELAKEFGLEELRDYLTRSRREIDRMRGRPIA
jgi:predicted amidohydrolase